MCRASVVARPRRTKEGGRPTDLRLDVLVDADDEDGDWDGAREGQQRQFASGGEAGEGHAPSALEARSTASLMASSSLMTLAAPSRIAPRAENGADLPTGRSLDMRASSLYSLPALSLMVPVWRCECEGVIDVSGRYWSADRIERRKEAHSLVRGEAEEEVAELLVGRVLDDELVVDVDVSLAGDDKAKLPLAILVGREGRRPVDPARHVDRLGDVAARGGGRRRQRLGSVAEKRRGSRASSTHSMNMLKAELVGVAWTTWALLTPSHGPL